MNKILLFFTAILLYRTSIAQTSYVWNGTTSTSFTTNTNWTPNGVPGAADNITIVTGANNCILSGNTTVTNLTITSGVLNLNGFTLNTTGVVACNGGNCNNGTFNSTATSLTFAGTTFGANITANVNDVYFNGSTFNGSVTVTKNSASNIQSTGNNVFNGVTSITNAGTGYLLLTNGAAGRNETFNASTTFNTTNTGALYIGYQRNVAFNANVTVNNPTSTGLIQIGRVGTVTLNTGNTITCGTFAGAALNLYNLSQTGSTALSLSPGSSGAVNIYGSSINGSLTINAGIITAQTSTFAAAVNYNISGTIMNNWSNGGNTYNGVLTVNNSSNGYIGFANGTADTYNNDVYANNTSTTGGRIIFGNNCTSQFNGNIYVSQSGPNTTSGGIALGWGGTFPIINIAAGKSIITSGTNNSGYLQLYRVQQADATPINLNTTGTTNVILTGNVFTGDFTVTAPDITPNGGTYNGTATFNKTGGTSNHNSGNLNIFNSTCTINQTSSTGYFMLGYNSADQFNDNITVTSTGTGGIRLGHNGGTGTPTLASGKTINIGGAGFSAGYLLLGSFTQLGSAAINLPMTGTGSAFYISNPAGPCVIGGALTVTAADLYIQGGTFNGATVFTKTGGTSNHNNGNQNIFNSTLTINQQSNNNYFMLGYNSNDLFNDDITVTSTGTGGIYLGYSSGTGTPTLASGKTISIGGAGFSAGFLYFGAFTQLGSAPINLTLTGANTSLNFRASTFGGDFTSTSPAYNITSSTFNGIFNATKTGASNDANPGGNTFNGTTTIANSGAGYFGFAWSSPDTWNGDVTFTNSGSERILPAWNVAGNMFNGNITVNSTGSSTGIHFCGGASATATLAATKTINTGTYDKGYLVLNRFTQLGNAVVNLNLTATANYLAIGPTSTFGGNFTAVAPSVNNVISTTFNGIVDITKNGAANDQWTGGNTFGSTSTILNSGSGYLMLGVTNPETFNGDVTFTNSGSNYISPSYNSTGNLYNGNITVNSFGSSLGINFGSGASSTSTLAATKTIQIGGSGFTSGYLLLQRFTQLGSAPINLTLPVGSNYLSIGPNSTIGGNLTVDAQSINNIRQSTFNGVVSITKNGNTNDAWTGGNTFNSTSTFINNTAGYLLLGNGSPDIFNDDVTFTNTGSERILPAYSSAGNQFNGNINVNSTGSSVGIHFCSQAISTATLAATKTIQVGGSGFTSGYLILPRFTQLGSAAVNLSLGVAANYIQFGPSSAFGGNVTTSSPGILFNGCTFSGTVNSTKTGTTNDQGSGNNIFNGNATFTNSGAGYLMFGNGNLDQFNAASTFNNTGSSNIYVAHNSSNNVFGGVATFNNSPTANTLIYVSPYSAGTVFNDNIVVTSSNGQGVQFCGSNTTASATLASGKTITVGGSGFSAGTLLLKQFTQLGATPQSLTLTGSSILQYGPSSTFNGNVTSVSPRLYFNGCTFNGTANCTKNGATDDQSTGNNIFNGVTTITGSGSGYLMFGNGNSDQFNNTTSFINTGTNNMHIAYNSSNNIFGGVTTFSNSPTGNFGIYVASYSSGTQFNDNIVVSSTTGQGVQFCSGNATATATLAASKTISIGSAGFSAGTLLLKQFTQVGATAQTLNQTTGSGILTLGPSSRFDGNVNFNFPQVYLNGTTYNGTASIQKNGATDNAGNGGNTFNSTTTITNSGSGYLLTGNVSSDAFNGVTTFNNTGSYRIFFAHNHGGQTTTFAQATTLNTNKSGGADGWSYFIAEGSNTNVRFDGDVTINIAGTLQSNLRTLQGSNSTATFNGNLNINLTNTNSNTQVQLGTSGNTSYNGNITLVNTGAGTGGGVFFNTAATSTSTLASGRTISLGAGGFTGGTLSLIRLTQLGSTAQTLTQTTGTGILISGPTSTFNGNVDFNFPQIYLNGTTYNGTATIRKNGATDNASVGGNIFNGTTTITNTSANFIRLANTNPDNYNADVTFAQNNSGVLAPNYNANCTYGGNVTVSSSSTYTITFGSGTGTATFSGGNAQTINKSGSVGNPVFTRLVMNKTANDVTLNTRINISTSLTLTQGLINTTSTNILNMNNASTTTIGNALSYINGPMNYDMALSGSRALNFPIGKSADWRPVTLTAVNNSATSYTYKGEVTNANANSLGYVKPATVDTVSHVHYWDIDRSLTSTGVASNANVSGNQTILIYYGANDGVTDPSNLTIVKNTSAAPTNWIDIGGTGATAGAGSVSSTSSPSAFTSYSRFTLANKKGGTNPLPIELLYFTANPVEKKVNLDWATASETNNSHFEIERSADGVNFEYVASINAYGDGNSVTKQTYTSIDEKPYKGISYYRLKQVDKTGEFKYAPVVSVEFKDNSYVNVFPNPAHSRIMIKASEDYINASLKVINTLGVEVVANESLESFNGLVDLSHLANGIYYVVIKKGEQTENIKISLQK
ncbi:MAG: T9SS type A sorting domain-containing protein [Bacteroidia bacterium]